MKLNRTKLNQMIDSGAVNFGGRRNAGGGGGGGGGVSQEWIEQNYISKAFFTSLFKVFVGYGSNATEIEPNDEMPIPDTTVNIKAIYGLWTEKFMSTLGQGPSGGGGGGGASSLSELLDVTITNPQPGQLLQYSNSHWVNVELSTIMSAYATRQWCLNTFLQESDIIHPTSIWGQDWPSTNSAINGDMSDVGDITMKDGNRYIYFGTSNQNFYIKKISDRFIIKANGTEVVNIYNNKLYASVQIHSSVGVYSDGYVTALSDIRKKDVKDRFEIDVEKIASASLIHFKWKDRHDNAIHAGCIAQEWQEILPEAVVESEDGTLALDYGVIAAASAISLARKVEEQQKEISELKRKNEELENRLLRIEKLLKMEGRV